MQAGTIAPGARILCRDAEWLVRSTTIASDGSFIIDAIGVSEFIKGKTARFVEELESDLQVLLPEETKLVNDNSSGYKHSLLFIEAHLKQTAPDDGRIYQGQRAAMDILDYQLWPSYKALSMPRQRILIADAVGLGKTLECGILVSELIRRGLGRRILVVTTKSMMVQFQKEFWSRFTIPLVKLDSTTIQRVRTNIPGNHNPFHYYDRSIISVDTLKQDREYRSYLEKAYWDIIIIDEAHNVAKRGRGQSASQRAKLANRLSTRSDTLILLSATPHDGRPESFASLMNMLDPTAIANESDYTQDDIRDLYVRRFKKDVLQDLKQHIPERNVSSIEAMASSYEERAFEQLNDLNFERIDSHRQAGQLFKTTLLKAMLSSPAACLETVGNRLRRLGKDKDVSPADLHDIHLLNALKLVLEQIDATSFTKYQLLLKLIKTDFGWNGKDPKDRLVIFTGRLETLKFLQAQLAKDLKLKPEAVISLDGGMSDTDQNQIVESFGQEKEQVRILIATEVASEGLNLHYLCHKLIHFDIPWSLMTLQQRNGRIDRYGQTRQPEIRYMLTRSKLERMDEVERIIKVLLEKDEQAIKNIGDPSVFMGVFDSDSEETYTANIIESGNSAEDFSRTLDSNVAHAAEEIDIFALFANPDLVEDANSSNGKINPKAELGMMPTLFASNFEYATTALQTLEQIPSNLNINEAEPFIECQLPVELEQRYQRLPKEILPGNKSLLHLTENPHAVMQAMEKARREESSWPAQQYLWELHPFLEWLTDRCLFRFGRHQAPVLKLPDLSVNESVFILFGNFPNRRGTSILSRWISSVFSGGEFMRIEPFDDTVERTQLGKKQVPNPGQISINHLLPLRNEAIAKARAYLNDEQKLFNANLSTKLKEQKERLDKLQQSHMDKIEQSFDRNSQLSRIQQQRRIGELGRIDKIFKDYRDWVELSMTTETEPFIKLVAVLIGDN
ncbi:helicase domain protein (plasmid) [Thalassoporum mexicanum PCC 7367]|uniref:DEAD/DEAH box helicase n=1 Tax=Thalassoporum mexicanum TaxID=3457544 RepID=UPI00029FB2BE|nr:DEAD/DEAH box helicase [Pseudanabaena sp. PCC 7367]AFY71950.1 helicase domain protein [Pseudanabaena sp. PCC 7367]